jgi:hypothetical protein
MSLRYYRRAWDESRGDKFDTWGHSVWYFEIDDAGHPVRQIEQYERGPSLGYDAAHPEDEYGGLSDQPLDPKDFAGFEITREEFERAWAARAGK